MADFDLNDTSRHIHFIGIGGISLSAIAKLLVERGFTVSGSDMKKSALTEELESMGVHIDYPQKASNIVPGIDIVVYTSAIHPDNPEFAAAKAAGITMYQRAVMLGFIMKHYKNAIAVAGTHGKTTTTSMVSYIYLEDKGDPTIFVGGILDNIHGNMRSGKSENFVAEACEYTDSFLHFFPTSEIITNIEPEHLDYFGDLAHERASFKRFIGLLPENGLLVINDAIADIASLTSGSKAKVVTYGLSDSADYRPANISYDENGFGHYDLIAHGKNIAHIALSVPGEHNISDSLAAIAVAMEHGISASVCAAALSKYKGAERRMEYKGTFNGAKVYDDYAHHPSEIRATLTACRQMPHDRLIVAFQPHLYSRTKFFLNDFIDVLGTADIVALADIYAAREKDPGDISSKDIADGINAKGAEKAYYLGDFEKIKNFLMHTVHEGDLLITMGAGNIVEVGDDLVKS